MRPFRFLESILSHHIDAMERNCWAAWPFKIPSKPSDHVALGGSFSKDRLDRQKAHGRVFVGRAGLAAFSAAARAFEGRDVAVIGGSQANPESIISFSAAAGDGLQSTRSGLPRRRASRTPDLLTC